MGLDVDVAAVHEGGREEDGDESAGALEDAAEKNANVGEGDEEKDHGDEPRGGEWGGVEPVSTLARAERFEEGNDEEAGNEIGKGFGQQRRMKWVDAGCRENCFDHQVDVPVGEGKAGGGDSNGEDGLRFHAAAGVVDGDARDDAECDGEPLERSDDGACGAHGLAEDGGKGCGENELGSHEGTDARGFSMLEGGDKRKLSADVEDRGAHE